MPSGKTHEKVNFIFLFIIIFFLLISGSYYFIGIFGALISLFTAFGFYFGTYYFSPDLDTKSRPFYKWRLLRFIWIPYQKIFKHRSFWTHGILIGDVVRFLYFSIFIYIFYSVSITFLKIDPNVAETNIIVFIKTYKFYFLSFFIGNVLASFAHIIADKTVSGFKRKSNYKNRKRK